MPYWNWIPHTGSFFNSNYPPKAISDILSVKELSIYPNERDAVQVSFTVPKKQCVQNNITINADIISVDGKITATIDIDNIGLTTISVMDQGTLPERIVSICVAKIFVALRQIIFKNSSESISNEIEPDYRMIESDDRSVALNKIFDNILLNNVENDLYKANELYNNEYGRFTDGYACVMSTICRTKEHLLNAWRYTDIFEDILQDTEKKRTALTRMEYMLKNIESEVQVKWAMNTSANTESINFRMFWLTVISIAVAFFAGSITNEVVNGTDNPALSAIAIVAAAMVIAGIYACSVYRKI